MRDSLTTTKIAVVGLGTMGAQALWVLSGYKNVEVLGYEQFGTGHDRGAAGGESRIFRKVQHESPQYVPLVQRADELYQKLDTDSGRQHRGLNGCVVFGPQDDEGIQNSIASGMEHHLDFEVLEKNDAARQFPQFKLAEYEIAVYDKGAGFIRPELTIQSAVMMAEQNGATVHRQTKVQQVLPDIDGVQIITKDGVTRVDKVIVATGPWVTQFLPDIEEVVTVKRPVSAWFPTKPGAPTPQGGPAFVRRGGINGYGVPSHDGISFKVGLAVQAHKNVENPDEAQRDVSMQELEGFSDFITKYLPHLHPEPIRTDSYFEAYIDDSRPIVQSVPEHDNVVLVAGFSGHGFKLAPAYGEIAARLAMEEDVGIDTAFLQRDLPALF